MLLTTFKQWGSQLRDSFFKSVHGNNLVYNTCWEDPRVDRQLLGLNANSRVVMITSAGCNALDYLLDGTAEIFCVDINARQNALLNLKQAAFQTSHEDLFKLFGKGYYVGIKDFFKKALAPHLPDVARKYWNRHYYFFSGKGLRKSFYYYSTSGVFAWLFRQYCAVRPKLRRTIQLLIEATDIQSQTAIYNRLEPILLNGFIRWVLRRHVTLSLLGVPRQQRQLILNEYPGGMAGFIASSLRNVFTNMTVSDNYFWRVYITGHYTAQCCPNYLKPEYFEFFRENRGRIRTFSTTVTKFLQQNPGKYTHFVLLDHQDWLAAYAPELLAEEWEHILKNAAPKAKVLFRSASLGREFVPEFAKEAFEFQDEKTAYLQKTADRVGTYATTHLGILK